MGFHRPTTTQTPDPIFDYWLPRLTGAELRVLLYAVRRTYGFKKGDDNISLEQFEHGIRTEDGTVLDEGCGCSRKSILRAIKLLGDKGLLIKTRRRDADRRDDVNNYRLHVVDERQEPAERGFRPVNTTQVPDEVFDRWLPHLSDAELCVLLYVIRRTLGFRKPADVISPQQFLTGVRTRAGTVLDDGCGVSKKHLYLALAGLKDKGLIAVQRRRSPRAGNIPSAYSLLFDRDVPTILSGSADDVDPRATAYDASADGALVTGDPALRSTTCVGSRTGTGQQRVVGAPREEHGDAKGGANGRLEGGTATPRGARLDDQRGTSGRPEGRLKTPEEARSDDRGYGSERAPQQTTRDQQTRGHETGDPQTDRQDHNVSKTSRRRAPAGEAERTARYSALLSQRIADLSLLFHDQDHEHSNRTRTLRLWAESGLGEQTFADMVQEARLIAMKRGNIEKTATHGSSKGGGTRNRMPYFFAVLEDLVDMARDAGSAARAARSEGGRGPARPPGGEPAVAVHKGQSDTVGLYGVADTHINTGCETAGACPAQEPTATWQEGDGATKADRALWASTLDELRLVLTRENYTTWLASTYVVGRDGPVLHVAVPTRFHLDWLTHKLGNRIRAALDRLGHDGVQIEYVVAQADTEGRE